MVVGARVVSAALGNSGAALQLQNSGKLPTARNSLENSMRMHGVSQVDRVSVVEEVPAIGGLHSIVGSQVEWIDRNRSIRLPVRVIQDNPERFLPGVVRLHGKATRVASPRYLQSIVVGVRIIGRLVDISVTLQRPESICIGSCRIACGQH